jgi:hypothetical protein
VKTISRNRARLKRQGYRENKGSKGNKRNKTEDKMNTRLKSGFRKERTSKASWWEIACISKNLNIPHEHPTEPWPRIQVRGKHNMRGKHNNYPLSKTDCPQSVQILSPNH